MASKLPWATAAIIIVAAVAVGTWAIFGAPPAVVDEEPKVPAPGEWDVIPVVGLEPTENDSGIKCIIFAKEGTNLATDPETWGADNYYAKLTAAGPENVPYENNFYIVVVGYGNQPAIAYTVRENIKVELGLTGALSIEPPENKTGTEFSWYDNTSVPGRIRVSAVWGPYSIPAAASFDYTAKVWLWR